MTVHIHILGSAAGGGFPQWNCNCRQCAAVRAGRPGFAPRTQSSIAVTADGRAFALVNASPDLRAQILATPALQPARAVRDSAIAGVILMDAQIDHVAGLLLLRESPHPLRLYASARVHQDLTRHLPLASVLGHYCGVDWREIAPDRAFAVDGVDGVDFIPVPLTSKPPPYSPHRESPQPGDNVGLVIRDRHSGRSAFYAPGLGVIDAAVERALRAADVLLVDGTCWTDDEMARTGAGSKRARDMGHLPLSDPGGMLETLAALPARRRVLVHINNTNPILDEGSAERATLTRAGVEVGHDGMVIEL